MAGVLDLSHTPGQLYATGDTHALGQNPLRRITRMIDPDAYRLTAEVTVLEDSDDELEITKHPVEQGAAISDHAYKQPAELHVQVGWSDASKGGDASQVYEQILYLQAERRPFIVYTGKRTYQNMLVASIRQHTDEKMEYGFLADVIFREILLVNTQTAGGGGMIGTAGNLGDPASNTPTVTQGTLQNQPATLDANQTTDAGGDFGGGGDNPDDG